MVAILTLKESNSIDSVNEPIQIGLPFKQGEVFSSDDIWLIDCEQRVLVFNLLPLTLWPDNSIKWGKLEFNYSLKKNQQAIIFLKNHSHKTTEDCCSPIKPISFTELAEQITITTNSGNFVLDKSNFTLSQADENTYLKLQSSKLEFINDKNNIVAIQIGKISFIEQSSIISKELKIEGEFVENEQEKIKFTAVFKFYNEQHIIKCDLTIHNPSAANHPGGQWDLGDENSVFFKSLSLKMMIKNGDSINLYQPHKNSDISAQQTLQIFQHNSGGENRFSKNHINRYGKIDSHGNGYQIIIDDEEKITGQRINPCAGVMNNKHEAIHIFQQKFWQNFPSAIHATTDSIKLYLFPSQKTSHELQPGESKTQSFFINFSNLKQMTAWPKSSLECHIELAYFESTKVNEQVCVATLNNNLSSIIAKGIDSDNDFFHKRERIDDYGWRNFGDLYADHEELEYQGKEPLISHYNNQYDPLYGFLKMYLLTQDCRYFSLAEDLAQHIKDIDIYRTTKDKEVYNGGMFWHTDHYLSAATSTHRTFSKEHKLGAYQEHQGGGGPGGQHCYTTGLYYHYLLTGDETSKQAVLSLTQWIKTTYEGTATFCEFIFALKNHKAVDKKNIFRNRYSLDRGTGNYVVSLLNSYELTLNNSFLVQAEHVIEHTIACSDNIDNLKLDEPESTWFYTIFLQSVSRYLQVKNTYGQIDTSFQKIKSSFLHYTNWMLNNEDVYLKQPDKLEFPNNTWVAQDVRKASILFDAAMYDHQRSELLINKANDIYNYVEHYLRNDNKSTYTRILAILMQNLAPKELINCNEDNFITNENIRADKRNNTLMNLGREFYKCINKFSLKRELHWLSHRSKFIAILLNKKKQ